MDLHDTLNALLNNDPIQAYTFQHDSQQINTTLEKFTAKLANFSTENTLTIHYHP
jgi:hypothetical protein